MNPREPIVLAAGEGDKQSFLGGGLHTWKLLAENTDGAFFLFEDVMVKGKSTPLHRHPEADEMVYILEGEVIVNVVFQSIISALHEEEKVELRGFGAFSIKSRNARVGRNPRTGEAVQVARKSVPFFKTGKDLRDRLNSRE